MTEQEWLVFIGNKIYYYRNLKQKSLKWLSEKTGNSEARLLTIENGEMDVDILSFKHIAERLDIELYELVDDGQAYNDFD